MLIAQRPTLTEESLNPQRSRFTIEPLEPGFGYTLGTSLRRTLLSSIPGAAVTSVRISGALHEFTTLPGVQEDVTEILLNIKGIVLTSEYDEPVVMYLRKSGKGVPVKICWTLLNPASSKLPKVVQTKTKGRRTSPMCSTQPWRVLSSCFSSHTMALPG